VTGGEKWALAILAIVGGFVLLGHLGVDISGPLVGSLHGLERLMARPL
jgi:hypothetical protein